MWSLDLFVDRLTQSIFLILQENSRINYKILEKSSLYFIYDCWTERAALRVEAWYCVSLTQTIKYLDRLSLWHDLRSWSKTIKRARLAFIKTVLFLRAVVKALEPRKRRTFLSFRRFWGFHKLRELFRQVTTVKLAKLRLKLERKTTSLFLRLELSCLWDTS